MKGVQTSIPLYPPFLKLTKSALNVCHDLCPVRFRLPNLLNIVQLKTNWYIHYYYYWYIHSSLFIYASFSCYRFIYWK